MPANIQFILGVLGVILLEITFLGTGTSHGVPIVGCNCKTCTSDDPKNNRFRSSIYIKNVDKNILNKADIPCYGNKETLDALKRKFSYIFKDHPCNFAVPSVKLIEIKDTL